MPEWPPFLVNCPSQISEFFISRNIHFEEYGQNHLKEYHCIILSTWHSDKAMYWLGNLKLLRRTGVFNPVILLSFQTEATIFSQILFPHEGIYFLRLPFQSDSQLSLFLSAYTRRTSLVQYPHNHPKPLD